MKRLWKVSLGKNNEFESDASNHSLIQIWFGIQEDIGDLGTREKLFALMKKIHPEAKDKTRKNFAAQVNQFCNEMQIGDLVICPFSSSKTIYIGKIISDYLPHQDTKNATRKVEWLKQDLPRDTFKQDLLHSFGAIMTVCQIQRNNALSRVEDVIRSGMDPGDGQNPEFNLADVDENPEDLFDLEQIARDQIEKRIASEFAGHDFTNLVSAILQAQGYQTYVSPPGPDKGIDILAGSGKLGLENPRVVVQVKSGSVVVDQPTVQGLLGSIADQKSDYGLIVSWGGFTSAVRSRMSELYFRVRFWDRTILVDNLLENYDQLPESVRVDLPLKRIWVSVNEDT